MNQPFKLFNTGTSAGAKLGWEHRQKDGLGFAVPMPGDQVFTYSPGIFGMPIRIGGTVAPGGKHVNINEGPTNAKRVGIGQAKWTVAGGQHAQDDKAAL